MSFETFLVGLVVAVFFVELTDIYPGGIIVPAYFALYLDQPFTVAVTIAVAAASLVSYRLLSWFFILYGKRRFVMLILFGVIWAQVWALIFPQFFPDAVSMKAIGWLIPGLLANNLEKQKVIPTLASLFIVATITYFAVRILAWF